MIALFFPRVVYYYYYGHRRVFVIASIGSFDPNNMDLSTIRYMVPIYEGNTKQYSLEILGAAGAFSDDYTNNLY